MVIKENLASVPICCCVLIDNSIGKIYVRVESDYVVEENGQTTKQELVDFDESKQDDKTINKHTVQQLYKPTQSSFGELKDFMSRPVLIGTVTLPAGAGVNVAIDPWYSYFNHTAIKKKLDNYAFVRCDLHIKIVINSTPFYYGAYMATYHPMDGVYGSAPITTGVGTSGQRLVNLSQRPHIDIYPQDNKAGEMILPFIYHKEWLDVTSATDLQNMGRLRFVEYVVSRTVGAGTLNNIEVQVFAWTDNIQLNGMTVSLAVQGDEYKKDGPISKPASAIARSANILSKVPYIGPFATATSIGASAVANIASLFGYTKVPTVSNTTAVKNMPFRGFASSDIGDVGDKLTIDAKNELTINGECVGDPLPDYMNIATFCQHGSYLTQFNWTSASSSGTLLWNSYITPYMAQFGSITGATRVFATPMWLTANMFEFWRGDIIFDFKIICTKYHNGRLRFSWDPIGDIAGTVDSITTAYNQIVDIRDSTQVSIRVPYMQRVSYLKIPSDPTSTIFSTGALSPDHSDTINGILTCRVLTEQTSPATSADISVLVYVRAAENIEFACPKEVDNRISYFEVQSDVFKKYDEPETRIMGEASTVDSNINLVYFGETITSFRELLQRTNLQDIILPVNSTTNYVTHNYSWFNRRPLFPGYDPNGIHTATGIASGSPEPYNFVTVTPYNLLAACFNGERGSITWHINCDAWATGVSYGLSRSRRLLTQAGYGISATTTYSVDEIPSRELPGIMGTTMGTNITNQKTNAGLSTITPMYSNLTMLETQPAMRTLGLSDVSTDDSLVAYTTTQRNATALSSPLYRYYNVGPDHSFVWFLNVPILYVYSVYPTL